MLNQFISLILNKCITLSPEHCEKDIIRKNIEDKLVNQYCDKYSKDYGYINSIKNVNIIRCVKIFSDGYAKFDISYNIQYLKPIINNVYKATVFLISNERKAIMCHVDNVFNILLKCQI